MVSVVVAFSFANFVTRNCEWNTVFQQTQQKKKINLNNERQINCYANLLVMFLPLLKVEEDEKKKTNKLSP